MGSSQSRQDDAPNPNYPAHQYALNTPPYFPHSQHPPRSPSRSSNNLNSFAFPHPQNDGHQPSLAFPFFRSSSPSPSPAHSPANSLSQLKDSDLNTVIDFGSLAPSGLYHANQDWEVRAVRKLILDRRMAPFYKGLNDPEDWMEAESTTSDRPSTPASFMSSSPSLAHSPLKAPPSPALSTVELPMHTDSDAAPSTSDPPQPHSPAPSRPAHLTHRHTPSTSSTASTSSLASLGLPSRPQPAHPAVHLEDPTFSTSMSNSTSPSLHPPAPATPPPNLSASLPSHAFRPPRAASPSPSLTSLSPSSAGPWAGSGTGIGSAAGGAAPQGRHRAYSSFSGLSHSAREARDRDRDRDRDRERDHHHHHHLPVVSNPRTVSREDLFASPIECPICFLYYPRNINRARCCGQPICTECFVQIKRDGTSGEIASCPFCVEPDFGITYNHPDTPEFRREARLPPLPSSPVPARATSPIPSGPGILDTPDDEHKSVAEPGPMRRRVSVPAKDPRVVSADDLRPEWSRRMVQLVAARAAAASGVPGSGQGGRRTGFGALAALGRGREVDPDRLSSAATAAAALLEGAIPRRSPSPSLLFRRQHRHTPSTGSASSAEDGGAHQARRRRGWFTGVGEATLAVSAVRTMGADLEELMLLEAVRRSLLDSEPQASGQTAASSSSSVSSVPTSAAPTASVSSSVHPLPSLDEPALEDGASRPPLAVPALVVSTHGERRSGDLGERTPTGSPGRTGAGGFGLIMTPIVDGAVQVVEEVGGEAGPGVRVRSESQATAKGDSVGLAGVTVLGGGTGTVEVIVNKEAEAQGDVMEVAQAARG
ncbi:hypothetical protein M427DRAFT_32629 [Gonapodya prolifera JEL478]|uniref:RING-type domain-containing protein n=1 Tax=Gonapodya prolifera (strain JEL478) TaxID=1344416 RepID=A0A139AEK8_GONPJ|nr:hypothetical protein M427DRAFT_32629 [Gonapodya prolifera JEL478]|eukprot:KXS15180.1 hypothetical protein M427DRAFT_32629 [Gonapodya prolifera JEL478]